MPKTSTSSPTSIRLSEPTRKLLAEASSKTQRSQSYLVEETLKRFLPRLMESDGRPSVEERIRRLKLLQGVGARAVGPLKSHEIDARIRELRGDE